MGAPRDLARSVPLLGHLPALRRDPLALYAALARREGPVARLRLGPRTLLLLSGAEVIGDVLMNDLDGFEKGAGNAALRPLVGEGLFLAEGEAWRHKRAALRPLFTREHVDALAPVIDDEVSRLLARLDAHAEAARAFDLHAEVRCATLAIASRGIVGTDLFARRPELGDALERMWTRARELMGLGGPWALVLPLPSNAAFRRDRAMVHAALAEAVATRRRAPDEAVALDLMSVLRGADDLRDEMMTFLLTGQECASIAVAWSASFLSHRSGLAAAFGREGTDARALARQVLREAMRLRPPAWMMARTPTRDRAVSGERVRAGTILLLCTYNLHRDPACFPDPERFDPSRFAPDAPRPPRFSYMPFGVGPRTCIGMGLAMAQAEALLAGIFARYRVDTGAPPPPDPGMTLRPQGGLFARVTRRVER